MRKVRVKLKKIAVLPREVKLNMHEPETANFSGYNKALAGMMRMVTTNLTSPLISVPPIHSTSRSNCWRILESWRLVTGRLCNSSKALLPWELCEC